MWERADFCELAWRLVLFFALFLVRQCQNGLTSNQMRENSRLMESRDIAICALRKRSKKWGLDSHAFSHRTHFVQKKVKRMCGFTTIVSWSVTSQEVHIHGSHQPWHGWRWRWVHLEALGHINLLKNKKNKHKQHVICIYFWRWNIRQFPHGSNIATVICELELLP